MSSKTSSPQELRCWNRLYARRLAVDLRAGVLLLGDRNFAAAALLNHWAATGADLLVRCKSGRSLPPAARCRDGSTLGRL